MSSSNLSRAIVRIAPHYITCHALYYLEYNILPVMHYIIRNTLYCLSCIILSGIHNITCQASYYPENIIITCHARMQYIDNHALYYPEYIIFLVLHNIIRNNILNTLYSLPCIILLGIYIYIYILPVLQKITRNALY